MTGGSDRTASMSSPPAHRPVAVYRGGKPCKFHPEKHKFHRRRFHFFHLKRHTCTHRRPLPFPCMQPSALQLAHWLCCSLEGQQLQRRISGARLAEPHVWKKKRKKKLDPLVVSSHRIGGRKVAQAKSNKQKGFPQLSCAALPRSTMVAMEASFQFIIVSTRPGCVKSDEFLRLLRLQCLTASVRGSLQPWLMMYV